MQVTSSATPPVIVDGVWKRFGSVDVVKDFSFEADRGEILGFLGPNGAGKTTTMRLILDIVRPDRGTIQLFGRPPGIEHAPRVGYLPEDRGLYRDVSVLDTLSYFGALKGMDTNEAKARARTMLTELGLGEALNKKGSELSRGMHQKAQVISTILHEPDLLVIDEPFQGLDPVNAEMLRQIVVQQRDRGAAVIMSTHDMNEAETLCDRIVLIDRGQRVLYGSVAEIKQRFADGAVIVRGHEVPLDVNTFTSVSEISRGSDQTIRFVLRDGSSPRDLFRELARSDASIDQFEVASPSLNEIFIRAVEGDVRIDADGDTPRGLRS